MVDSQQDQIDRIGEATDYSRANTRAGLEQIHQTVWGLCGERPAEKPISRDELRVQEEFKWSMPFETISDDMRAVHRDVMKFGTALLEDIKENVEMNGMTCAPIGFGYQEPVEERRRDRKVSFR